MTYRSPIFDAHAHIFPPKIAEKAVQSIGGYYGLPAGGPGTVEGLLAAGAPCGMARYLVHSTATRPEQVQAINDFISQACRADARLTGFGTLHPAMEDPGRELARFPELGLQGIKLHPDFQDFNMDAPQVQPLYALAEGKYPILMHVGDENSDRSSPQRLARVLNQFPDLTMIAAHLGGYLMWEEALGLLAGKSLYLDTSSSLEFLDPDRAVQLIRAYGADRILFGTDYPLWNPAEELERFYRLDLTDEEQEQILWKNTLRLLGLP